MKRKAFGSVLVLIVLSVVLAFLTGLNTWSRLELKSTVDYSHQKQAYYSARSGVLAMIEALKTMDTLPETEFSVVGTMEGIGDNATDATFYATYTPPGDGFEGIVQATGSSGNGAFSETLQVEWSLSQIQNFSQMITQNTFTVYGKDRVIVGDPAVSIKGNVGSNASERLSKKSDTDPGLFFHQNFQIEGSLQIGLGGDVDEFSGAVKDPTKVTVGSSSFPDPEIPPTPTNSSSLDSTISSPGVIPFSETEIQYNSLTLNAGSQENPTVLTLGTGNSSENTVVLITNSLTLNSHSSIEVSGQGKAEVYVLNSLSVTGKAKIGSGIKLYYFGEDSLTLSGQISFFSEAFFSVRADVKITGQASFSGNFFSANPIFFELTGSCENSMIIYAPHSSVKVTGSASSTAIICDTAEIGGSADLNYLFDEDIPDLDISFSSSSSSNDVFLWLETL